MALALLAYDLAGDRAGAVLGTALAIKMVAYVGLAPLAQAAAVRRLPRKVLLIGADPVRAGVSLWLPFVSEVWQIYLLIFVLQSASARPWCRWVGWRSPVRQRPRGSGRRAPRTRPRTPIPTFPKAIRTSPRTAPGRAMPTG